MSKDLGDEPPGATPLTDEDIQGLIPTWVATREDLNAVEQESIEAGVRWLRAVAPEADRHTTIEFSDELHRQLFGQVWKWAGHRRQRAANVGVDWYLITESMRQLFENARYWRENDVYSTTEQAVRLHRLLVAVHPYPNGNGRHTRILATSYSEAIGGEALTWGRGQDLSVDGAVRNEYFAALYRADEDDYEPLLAFAVS